VGAISEGGACFLRENGWNLLGPDCPACCPAQDARRSCTPVCLPLLSACRRSSLNPLHSVKNRAPAAIQVSFSLASLPVLCTHSFLRSLQSNYSEKYEYSIDHCIPRSQSASSRLKKDKSLSSVLRDNASKTLKNFTSTAVVNVKNSRSASVALEVACELLLLPPLWLHAYLSQKGMVTVRQLGGFTKRVCTRSLSL
jgi:hypothetical protein